MEAAACLLLRSCRVPHPSPPPALLSTAVSEGLQPDVIGWFLSMRSFLEPLLSHYDEGRCFLLAADCFVSEWRLMRVPHTMAWLRPVGRGQVCSGAFKSQ